MPDGMTPEIQPTSETPIKKWVNEVKKQLQEKKALGSVEARVNFDIEEDSSGEQKIKPLQYEGYKGGGIFNRGMATKEDGERLYGFMMSVNSSETGFPSSIEEDNLYVSIVKPANLNFQKTTPRTDVIKAAGKVMQRAIGENNSIVEVRYKQLKSDSRPDPKQVYLVVPDETALRLDQMVQTGIDPNELHNSIAEIFTTPETREYWDANIINRNNPKEIEIKAESPDLKQIFLSRTTSIGLPMERKVVTPDPLWKLDYKEPYILSDDTKPNQSTVEIKKPDIESTKEGPSKNEPGIVPVSSARTEKGNDINFKKVKKDSEQTAGDFEDKVKGLISGDKPEITDEWVQNAARLVAYPWGRSLGELNRILKEGNAKFLAKQINGDDWAKLAGLIFEEKQRLSSQKESKSSVSGFTSTPKEKNESPKGFVDQLAEAIHGKSLTQDEKYAELLDDEQWNNDVIQPIDPRSAPEYYINMTKEERRQYNIRVELANGCYIKRNKLSAPTLEALSKEAGYAGLSTSETAELDNIPGVIKAKQLIINWLEEDTVLGTRPDGSLITLRTAVGSDNPTNNTNARTELTFVRNLIRTQIQASVKDGFRNKVSSLAGEDLKRYQERYLDRLDLPEFQDILQLKAREAEQIAFNLLYYGNLAESLDSHWNYDSANNPLNRDRGPKIASELLSIPIRGAMKPLDSLIASLGKDAGKKSTVGRFGGWAYTQTLLSNGGNAIEFDDRKPNHIEEINVVPEKKENKNKFWTVTNNGKTLNVPECYPVKIVGSVWEETKAKMDDGTEVPLIEFMRKGNPIPWDKVKGENMWQAYAGKLGKAGAVWDLLQGKTVFRRGEYETVGLWIDSTHSALSEFGWANDVNIKRWILYASIGILEDSRPPKIRSNKTPVRKVIGDSAPGPTYLHDNELFFPWDGEGIMGILS